MARHQSRAGLPYVAAKAGEIRTARLRPRFSGVDGTSYRPFS